MDGGSGVGGDSVLSLNEQLKNNKLMWDYYLDNFVYVMTFINPKLFKFGNNDFLMNIE